MCITYVTIKTRRNTMKTQIFNLINGLIRTRKKDRFGGLFYFPDIFCPMSYSHALPLMLYCVPAKLPPW